MKLKKILCQLVKKSALNCSTNDENPILNYFANENQWTSLSTPYVLPIPLGLQVLTHG
jgi:hypothetical protein